MYCIVSRLSNCFFKADYDLRKLDLKKCLLLPIAALSLEEKAWVRATVARIIHYILYVPISCYDCNKFFNKTHKNKKTCRHFSPANLVEAAQHAGSGTIGEPSVNGATPNWNARTSPFWY